MRVALAQIDCLLGGLEETLRRAKEVIARAKDGGVDLVVFPELSLTVYSLGQVSDEVSLKVQSERIDSLVNEAAEMSLVIGFYEETYTPHTYNSAAYFRRGIPPAPAP